MKKRAIVVVLWLVILAVLVLALAPDTPIINSPVNGSVTTNSYQVLNITVTDPDSGIMNISIYGSNKTSAAELISFSVNVTNGTALTYNWSAPVIDASDPSLIALWRLDKNLSDYSGKNNHGEFSAPKPNISLSGGKLGGACNFTDLATDYIIINNTASLNITTNAVTLATWVNLNYLPSTMPPIPHSVLL